MRKTQVDQLNQLSDNKKGGVKTIDKRAHGINKHMTSHVLKQGHMNAKDLSNN